MQNILAFSYENQFRCGGLIDYFSDDTMSISLFLKLDLV